MLPNILKFGSDIALRFRHGVLGSMSPVPLARIRTCHPVVKSRFRVTICWPLFALTVPFYLILRCTFPNYRELCWILQLFTLFWLGYALLLTTTYCAYGILPDPLGFMNRVGSIFIFAYVYYVSSFIQFWICFRTKARDKITIQGCQVAVSR